MRIGRVLCAADIPVQEEPFGVGGKRGAALGLAGAGPDIAKLA